MPQPDSGRSRVSAAEVLTPVLAAQVTDLRAWEAGVRLDQPEATHGFRVAARRLRSLLAAFGPLMDQGVAEELAGSSSAQRRRSAGPGTPRSSRRGSRSCSGTSPRSRRRGDAGAAQPSARGGLRGRPAGVPGPPRQPGVRRVRPSARGFVDLPAWTDAAQGRAEKVLRPLLRAEWARFRKRTHRALDRGGRARRRTCGCTTRARRRSGSATSARRWCRFRPQGEADGQGRGAGAGGARRPPGLRAHPARARRGGGAGVPGRRNGFLLGRLQAREAAAAPDLRASSRGWRSPPTGSRCVAGCVSRRGSEGRGDAGRPGGSARGGPASSLPGEDMCTDGRISCGRDDLPVARDGHHEVMSTHRRPARSGRFPAG